MKWLIIDLMEHKMSTIPVKDIKQPLYGSAKPEVLIKKYFQQLTTGCGRSNCTNTHCVSGGLTALSCEEAAIMALKLLIDKAQICAAEPSETTPIVDQALENTITNAHPVLSLHYIQNIIQSCQNEFQDYKPLVRILGKIFSSPELLNKSFVLKESPVENSPESIIPVNYTEVIECYNVLLNLKDDSVENSIINGINALGNSIEIELKTTKRKLLKEDLHQFVIVMLNPNLHSPEYLENALPNILRALTMLPTDLQCTLVEYWSKYSSTELKKLLDIFQQMITVRILTGPHATTSLPVNDDHPITNSVRCLKLIYFASVLSGEKDEEISFESTSVAEVDVDEPMSMGNLLADMLTDNNEEGETSKDELADKLKIDVHKCRKPLIPYQDFVNECLNEAIETDRDFMHYKDGGIRFSFMNFPFVLNTATKSSCLFYDNRVRMYTERRMTLLYGLMQGQMPMSPYLRLKVRRDHLIADALVWLEMIAQEQPGDFKKQFVVEFDGEQGIDEGGVSKEFFQLVIEELFNPDFGMFVFNENNTTCWFNSASFETNSQFTLIGLLFGIAIYNSIILDVHFPPVLYRKLHGLPGRFVDLEDSHPAIYKSLKHLLTYENDLKEDIMATFEISYEMFGSTVNHELIKDGKNVFVDKNNRQEYVSRYADFLLNSSVKKQFEAFKRGFDIVTNDSLLKTLFRPVELELLVCGSQVFDVQELEATTEYDGGYEKDSPVIRNFWEVVHSMSHEELKQLLNFTTGSDRVPVGGLAKLKLTIAKNGEDSDRLPTAHTCFNVLLLPEYASLEKMRNRLLKAISNAKGFGLM